MSFFRDPLYWKALKTFALYLIMIFATRFGGGITVSLIVLTALIMISRRRIVSALTLYLMVVLMIEINPNIISLSKFAVGQALRFGLVAISMALVMSGMTRRGNYRMPMGVLVVYLCAACLSSMGGWAPVISYLKLVNFVMFFGGLWIGTQNLPSDPEEMLRLRAAYLAIAVFVILGSIALLPFPGISTLDGLSYNRMRNVSLTQDEINMLLRENIQDGDMSLVCGVMAQSQVLAPLVGCLFAWVLCDMLFVEQRFRIPHIVLLIAALPLVFKTRSRVGFTTLSVALAMIYLYLPKRIQIPRRVMRGLKQGMGGGAVLLIIVLGVMEVKEHSLTRWLRKTDAVDVDNRSFTEAFTSSRMGLVNEGLDDFMRNPLLGMGFQVNSFSQHYVDNAQGIILSAPIEKGVAPIMILGEGGIVGAGIFIFFLVAFYSGCSRRKMYLTATFFTILLATNLGEATLFSPGGLGGILWMVCVVGGFAMDNSMRANQMARIGRMW